MFLKLSALLRTTQMGDFKVKVKQPYRQTVNQGVIRGVHPSISVEYVELALRENNIEFVREIRMYGYKQSQLEASRSTPSVSSHKQSN